MGPKVSVIIPTYNLGTYVDDAVQSCLTQTHREIEVIVVDDGSTDAATACVLAGYRDPRVHVLRTERQGVCAARNLGAARATGDYLCFLDADDLIEATYFEKALVAFSTQPSLGFVFSWYREIGVGDALYQPERCDLPAVLAECMMFSAAVIRSDVAKVVGGFDPALEDGDEDWDYWIRVVAAGYGGHVLPEVLFYYRRRAGSRSELCYFGPSHLRLVRYLFEKHATLYARHRGDVEAAQTREISWLTQDIARLEQATAALESALENASAQRPNDALAPLLHNEAQLLKLRRRHHDLESRRQALERELANRA